MCSISHLSEGEREEADMKDKGEGRSLTWVCPKCRTAYYGWSEKKECEKCGYKESVKQKTDDRRQITED